MFETGVVRATEGLLQNQVRRHNGDILSIFFIMKVYCVFSLESPQQGNSNECTQYTIFNVKKKTSQIIPNLQLWDLFHGIKERVRNSRGNRAISVRAIEVPLYICFASKSDIGTFVCIDECSMYWIFSAALE